MCTMLWVLSNMGQKISAGEENEDEHIGLRVWTMPEDHLGESSVFLDQEHCGREIVC